MSGLDRTGCGAEERGKHLAGSSFSLGVDGYRQPAQVPLPDRGKNHPCRSATHPDFFLAVYQDAYALTESTESSKSGREVEVEWTGRFL
jgi:hypothetical protein